MENSKSKAAAMEKVYLVIYLLFYHPWEPKKEILYSYHIFLLLIGKKRSYNRCVETYITHVW